ncbi:MAG: hemerythrin domain-containing protein [Acidimicrobiales bacterium]
MPIRTQNVVALVKADHRRLERTLSDLDAVDDSGLVEFFCQLREELVRLAVAEELVVYPALRRNVPGADVVADACITEQAETEEALGRLEKLEDEPVALRACLLQLRRDVIVNARHEELDLLPWLEAHSKTKDLQDLGQRYAKALAAAPTHPHPHVFDAPAGNVALAPVATVVDEMRDAMSKSA